LTDLKQTRIKTDISEHLPTAQSLVKLKFFNTPFLQLDRLKKSHRHKSICEWKHKNTLISVLVRTCR